jgi:molybdate transport system substrate-binding protein
VAADQVLVRLGVAVGLRDRIVQGGSIGQTLQFVRSGAAELAFVARAQVIDEDRSRYWVVSDSLYDPIRQDAVLLTDGDAGQAFLAFLAGAEARAIIESFGYATEPHRP